MEKEGFIKYLSEMRLIFEAVSSAASSLMKMNVMNVSPTEEESTQLQEAFSEIAGHIQCLKGEAQEKIREYNDKKEKSAIASKAAIEEYTKMQENLIQLEKENVDAKIALEQKRAERDKSERDCKESETKLEEISRKKDCEVRKVKEKQENLKKWFWVPGYGIYLAVDTLINELDNEIGALSRQLERERQRRDELMRQYNGLSREMEERNRRTDWLRDRIDKQVKQMRCQDAMIEVCKKQLLYWEDFYMQISRLESKMETGENSPDMLYELIELMEAFENAAEE